jgi:hypothetical protein
MSLPINVSQCIEEYTGVSSRINNYAIHRDMPTFFIGVVVINVPPPSGETMIAFLNEEHLPAKCARSGSSLSLESNYAEASCQRGLQEAIMRGGMGRSTGTSLKT